MTCYTLDIMTETWDSYTEQWIFYHCGLDELVTSSTIKSDSNKGKISSCDLRAKIEENNISGEIK